MARISLEDDAPADRSNQMATVAKVVRSRPATPGPNLRRDTVLAYFSGFRPVLARPWAARHCRCFSL